MADYVTTLFHTLLYLPTGRLCTGWYLLLGLIGVANIILPYALHNYHGHLQGKGVIIKAISIIVILQFFNVIISCYDILLDIGTSYGTWF